MFGHPYFIQNLPSVQGNTPV